MSNYPSVPEYGTPYIPNGYAAQTGKAYSAEMSQFPYQVRRESPYTHAHVKGPSNGMTPAPHANAHSFDANAQSVVTSSNRVNNTLPKATTNIYPHELDFPPYTLVPLSYDNSFFPHSSFQNPTNSTVPSSLTHPPSKLPDLRSPSKDHTPEPKNPRSTISPASDLEDGEVDDEEIGELSNSSEENEMGLKFSRTLQQVEEEGRRHTVEAPNNRHTGSRHDPSSMLIHGNHFSHNCKLSQ